MLKFIEIEKRDTENRLYICELKKNENKNDG